MSRALDRVQTAILRISEDEMKAQVIRSAATIKIRPSKARDLTKKQVNARSEALNNHKKFNCRASLNPANTDLHAIDSAVTEVGAR